SLSASASRRRPDILSASRPRHRLCPIGDRGRPSMSESVIYCEGYHDRAFWMGWLVNLGCVDPGFPPPGRTGRLPIYDPLSTLVSGGQYAYHSRSGRFLRVVPCHGKSRILPAVRIRLGQRNSKALLRLVISIDSDVTASGGRTGPSGLQQPDVEQVVRTFDP